MKYVDEFRSRNLAKKIAAKIAAIRFKQKINIMEVCGTHTQSFYRFGIDKLLPENLELISGPGCPVCVSPQNYIDAAIELAKREEVIITTFGDMLRVPGNDSTLEQEKAKGAHISVVYSPLDALKTAGRYPAKKVVFLAVGFETTAPAIALSVLAAKREKIKNIFFFTSLKTIPPAMRYLVKDKRLKVHGFLCPGHVSSIIGTKPYDFIPAQYGIGCCVAGFEPVDILEGLYLLLRQITEQKPAVQNQYIRAVSRSGNTAAQRLIRQVFAVSDGYWRGLGNIPQSGYKINKVFSCFDAAGEFLLSNTLKSAHNKLQCQCGEVLKGLIRPDACRLFKKSCTPERPIGPCMVSQEGACNVYYKYHQ